MFHVSRHMHTSNCFSLESIVVSFKEILRYVYINIDCTMIIIVKSLKSYLLTNARCQKNYKKKNNVKNVLTI